MLERMQFLHPHLEDGAAPALMAGAMPQAQENAAPQEADSAPSAQERFDELIRGEFKDAYQAKMQAALDRRFKQARATEERMKALEPVAKALSEHYGVSESELPRAMERAGAQPDVFVINNLTPAHVAESAKELAKRIGESQMVFLRGGPAGGARRTAPRGCGKANGRNERRVSAIRSRRGNAQSALCRHRPRGRGHQNGL